MLPSVVAAGGELVVLGEPEPDGSDVAAVAGLDMHDRSLVLVAFGDLGGGQVHPDGEGLVA